MRPAVVYRFFDIEGGLLYVGMTSQGVLRWAAHAKDQPWWFDVATVTVEHYSSMASALDAEEAAIRTEQPRWNTVYRPPLVIRPPEIRRHRTGSLFQRRTDGRWVACISYRGRRPSRTFLTREEAEAGLVRLQREYGIEVS